MNEAVPQAMLRVLERVVGAQTKANNHDTITKRLHLVGLSCLVAFLGRPPL